MLAVGRHSEGVQGQFWRGPLMLSIPCAWCLLLALLTDLLMSDAAQLSPLEVYDMYCSAVYSVKPSLSAG